MSFTTDITEELLQLPIKKTCCRKALLLGILCACRTDAEGGMTAYFYHENVANLTEFLLKKVFNCDALLNKTVRAGRKTWVLSFRSSGVSAFLEQLDGGCDQAAHMAVGFRCPACRIAFLRGVFYGTATVTDPRKGYHAEMIFPTEGRANFVSNFLTDIIAKPIRVKRGERHGCAYKCNSSISDLLYYIGCSGTSFDVANVCIERDIRNQENRATNCVTRNISHSVAASLRHREAIQKLIATRRIDTLPKELRQTAALRMEYESASLQELALLHEPPISKSGLNRRLSKLMEAAGETSTDKA